MCYDKSRMNETIRQNNENTKEMISFKILIIQNKRIYRLLTHIQEHNENKSSIFL